MERKNEIKRKLKNAEGMRLLEKTKLEYSKEIINELKKDPKKLSSILENAELTELELFEYLSGEKKANIVLYDQVLTLAKRKI